jgi:hypothetical protein
MPTLRRFPPPWSIEELKACFVVRDGTVTECRVPQAGKTKPFANCAKSF